MLTSWRVSRWVRSLGIRYQWFNLKYRSESAWERPSACISGTHRDSLIVPFGGPDRKLNDPAGKASGEVRKGLM